MEFGRWYPLAEAATHAPVGPGVIQVRIRTGLIDYPRGKSAMVHYAATADVRAAAVAFAAAHRDRDWLCRHLLDVAPDVDPIAIAARLTRDFTVRFGSPPTPPTTPTTPTTPTP